MFHWDLAGGESYQLNNANICLILTVFYVSERQKIWNHLTNFILMDFPMHVHRIKWNCLIYNLRGHSSKFLNYKRAVTFAFERYI